MGKRTDYAMLRQGVGLSRGLSEELLQPSEPSKIGGMHPCDFAHELARGWMNEDGTFGLRRKKTNGNAPSTAPVVYVQPEFEELKRRFPGYVNNNIQGKHFDPIERCKDVSKENREVAFEYVGMYRDASTDEILAEMDRKGLRPALYEELLGLGSDEKYPDERWELPIVALGSETGEGGRRGVAYLGSDGDGNGLVGLCLHWIVNDWHGHVRFLAVRK